MLDWIFEGIVKWAAGVASELMDTVSGLFLDALGTDMTAMEEYFPFVTKAFTVMQYCSWAILFLITVWQLFRVLGGPITEAENPLTLIARNGLFAVLIAYAKPIFLITLDIARAPYTALLEISMTGEDFTFAGGEETLSNGIASFVAITSIGLLLILILLIALGWNYFKLLLETVERYVVVGVLCYTSPLAFSMGASKATSPVFKSWCRMVGSQLLLLTMNVWFFRGFSTSVGQFIGNGGALSNGNGSIFLWLFCALAFLKTAQRFDSYLASLGLNVAQTGSSMGMEMLMAARVLSGVASSSKTAVKGVEELNYRIETKPAFRIVGKSYPLNKEIEQNFLEVPQMWQNAVMDGTIKKIIALMNSQPQGVLGVSACNDNEKWKYYIAVSSTADIDTSLEEYIVPGCMWAIFPGGGTGKSIQELEKRIVTEWLPTSGYEFTEGPDIEVYFNPDPNNAQYEVWIPIKKV